ncbi:DUF3173 domain-containing protein [Brevibacillus laterosporus]|uniref:DUF3173 domain-containing protein n=1 Tax=Brevibacillus laterosporus TaxID=1465 RepID=UPI000E6D1031|nr:DUF3173 domain-containing protein [Brevibacillus laterosporus]AYB40071.1 DUF3173 domain-containing protein [Brevibacillus laterosporus]MBM7108481.1 hypothetical protein [Brevibacillus laterosporus]
MSSTITKTELVNIGYKEHTAVSLIRQAKIVMVQKGYPIYNNRRLGRVPRDVVESILGVTLETEIDIDGNTNKN